MPESVGWTREVKNTFRGRSWSISDTGFLCDMQAAGLTPGEAYTRLNGDRIEDAGYVAANCDLRSHDRRLTEFERKEWALRAQIVRAFQQLIMLGGKI